MNLLEQTQWVSVIRIYALRKHFSNQCYPKSVCYIRIETVSDCDEAHLYVQQNGEEIVQYENEEENFEGLPFLIIFSTIWLRPTL